MYMKPVDEGKLGLIIFFIPAIQLQSLKTLIISPLI